MSTPESTAAAAPMPGMALDEGMRAFGKYVLVRKLAQGGMAEIFLAKQVGAEGFERNVVIKRMLKELSNVPEFVGMFLDEARLAARLAHQNVVQINDLGLADGWYYICMEYLAGDDFSSVVRAASKRREYAPIPVVCRVIADAAHGLDFAHHFTDERGIQLGIVHRDISPSNIFVTYSGQVKVLDFGIAKAESRITNTATGVVKGKYLYMAPEQARGEPVDLRADVFSLGVSLYEALTHLRPFARENDLAILNAVLRCEFRRPREVRADLPEALEAIILKAMAARLEDRYQTAGEMARALEAFIGAQSSTSGAAEVATYIRGLAGEQQVLSKTRIPNLQSLLPPGGSFSSFTEGKTQAVSMGGVTLTGGNAVTRAGTVPHEANTQLASAEDLAAVRRSQSRTVLGAAVIASLIAVVGVLAGLKLLRPDPTPAAAPQVAAPAALVPPTPPAEAVDAGQVQSAVATSEGPGEETTRKASYRPKPVQLDAAAVQKVVARGTAPIMKCFETHKADLPSDKGKVAVTFTILASGKVKTAAVQGPLEKSAVGGCLVRNVSRLKFPQNVDEEITLTLPFNYTVQR